MIKPAHLALAAALLALVVTPAGAASLYVTVDVPSRLGGLDFTPNQIVRSDDFVYTLAIALPPDVAVSALHRRGDGTWLFSPEHPVTLQGATYSQRDIVAYDGATYSLFQGGANVGIPDGVAIDALFLDESGGSILSFDVPVTLGGLDYVSADLVAWRDGVWSPFWNSVSAGVPLSSNLVGADRDAAGVLIVSFDIPTRLSGYDFLPGQQVQWNGGASFSSFARDPGWPVGTQGADFALISTGSSGAGEVPDGTSASEPLRVEKGTGESVTLTWGASCVATDTDYEVYEGAVAVYYSHEARLCSTGGTTTVTFTPDPGSRYFLVTPRNGLREGSYGQRTGSIERPQGSGACFPRQIATCP